MGQSLSSSVVGTVNGAALNVLPLNGSRAGTAGSAESSVTYLRRGVVNGSALNVLPLNGSRAVTVAGAEVSAPAAFKVAYLRRGVVNGSALNVLPLNGSRTVTTGDTGFKVAYLRRGVVNGSALNVLPLNGSRVVTTGDAADSTTTYLRQGVVNGSALNVLPLNGSRAVVIQSFPQETTSTQEFVADVGIITDVFGELTGREVEDTGTLVSDTQGIITTTYESTLLAESTYNGQASFYVNEGTEGNVVSDIVASNRNVSQTIETWATLDSYLQESRGQYSTVQDGLSSTQDWTVHRTAYETVTVYGIAMALVVSAGVQFVEDTIDTSILTGDVDSQVVGALRTYEDLFSAAADLWFHSELSQYVADGAVITSSVTYDELVRRVLEVVESTAFVLSEVVQEKLSALAMYEDVARLLSEVGLSPSGEAWVFNTRSLAMSRYKDYDATQVASTSERLLAATVEGIASTDESKSLLAKVQWGVSDLGTPQLKRLRHVYFTAAGTKALKIVTRSGYGQALESTTYERPLNGTRVPTVYRVDLARGQRAPMWGFELVADADTNATVLDQRAVVLVDDRRV